MRSLPEELLLYTVNFIPRLPNPFVIRDRDVHYLESPLQGSEPRLQRTKTLLSLSQTCRYLRSFALPLAWESIEVVSHERDVGPDVWKVDLSNELYRKLDLVTVHSPTLGAYVRTVSAIFTDHAYPQFNATIAKLAALPRLETLNVLGEALDGAWLATSLTNVTFPSLRQLIIPDLARPLLVHCPNLEVVHVAMDQEEPDFFREARNMAKDLLQNCRQIKKVEGLPFIWKKEIGDMLQSFQNLTDIHLNSYKFYVDFPSKSTIAKLAGFKNLRNITLDIYNNATEIQDIELNRNVDLSFALLSGFAPQSSWGSSVASDDSDGSFDELDEYFGGDESAAAFLQYILPDGLLPPRSNDAAASLPRRNPSVSSSNTGPGNSLSQRNASTSRTAEENRVVSVEFQGRRTLLVNLVGSDRELFARITIDGARNSDFRNNRTNAHEVVIRREVGHRVPGIFGEKCCSLEVENFEDIDEEILGAFDHEQYLLSPPGLDDSEYY